MEAAHLNHHDEWNRSLSVGDCQAAGLGNSLLSSTLWFLALPISLCCSDPIGGSHVRQVKVPFFKPCRMLCRLWPRAASLCSLLWVSFLLPTLFQPCTWPCHSPNTQSLLPPQAFMLLLLLWTHFPNYRFLSSHASIFLLKGRLVWKVFLYYPLTAVCSLGAQHPTFYLYFYLLVVLVHQFNSFHGSGCNWIGLKRKRHVWTKSPHLQDT